MGGIPGVGLATVLHCEEVADEGGEDEGGADGVHLEDFLSHGLIVGDGCGGRTAEEEDKGEDGDAADGQVDVETPVSCAKV